MDFTGELGGALATAFGAGCVASYGFFHRTLVPRLDAQIEELKSGLASLQVKVDTLQEQRLEEMRQAAELLRGKE